MEDPNAKTPSEQKEELVKRAARAGRFMAKLQEALPSLDPDQEDFSTKREILASRLASLEKGFPSMQETARTLVLTEQGAALDQKQLNLDARETALAVREQAVAQKDAELARAREALAAQEVAFQQRSDADTQTRQALQEMFTKALGTQRERHEEAMRAMTDMVRATPGEVSHVLDKLLRSHTDEVKQQHQDHAAALANLAAESLTAHKEEVREQTAPLIRVPKLVEESLSQLKHDIRATDKKQQEHIDSIKATLCESLDKHSKTSQGHADEHAAKMTASFASSLRQYAREPLADLKTAVAADLAGVQTAVSTELSTAMTRMGDAALADNARMATVLHEHFGKIASAEALDKLGKRLYAQAEDNHNVSVDARADMATLQQSHHKILATHLDHLRFSIRLNHTALYDRLNLVYRELVPVLAARLAANGAAIARLQDSSTEILEQINQKLGVSQADTEWLVRYAKDIREGAVAYHAASLEAVQSLEAKMDTSSAEEAEKLARLQIMTGTLTDLVTASAASTSRGEPSSSSIAGKRPSDSESDDASPNKRARLDRWAEAVNSLTRSGSLHGCLRKMAPDPCCRSDDGGVTPDQAVRLAVASLAKKPDSVQKMLDFLESDAVATQWHCVDAIATTDPPVGKCTCIKYEGSVCLMVLKTGSFCRYFLQQY